MDIPASILELLTTFSSLNNPYIVSHVPVIFSQFLVPLASPFLFMIF